MSVREREMHADVRDWFARWGQCVAQSDYAGARALFADSVVGFGTYKDIVHGLDALENGQWRSIWPTIENFAFDLDSIEVLASPDGNQVVALVPWNSLGIAEDGSRYERPGRATVALHRVGDGDGAAWRGVHTHFSLCPAERKLSFG